MGSVQNGTNKLKLDFTYNTTTNGTPNADNNGNVLSQTITTPSETRGTTTYNAFTAVQTYQYDTLNRIKEAEEKIGSSQQWKQTFVYDRYGNRTFDEGSVGSQYKTTTLPRNCGTTPNLTVCPKDNPQPIAASNKLQGIEYDYVGNTKTDLDNRRFTYDGENKQIKVETTDGSGNVTGTLGEYFYDGDGKRVKKVSLENSQWITTIFVYDASGKMVVEYSTQLSTTPQVSYLTNDHLGSPRITTDANGQVISRRDFQPFGEEIQRANYNTDSVRQKFTSYERDNETELDFAQARYYGYNHGRFTSPDPLMASARKANPQTFNRYSYVLNNPYRLVDPSGMMACPPDYPNCQTDENGDYVIDADGVKSYVDDSPPIDGGTVNGNERECWDCISAEFQGPLPQNPIIAPNPQAQPQPAPSESTASKFGNNAGRSVRSSGPLFALSLLLNELINPSQSVGGDECDQGIPDCGEKEENRKTYYRGVNPDGTDIPARLGVDVRELPDGTLNSTRGISLNTDPTQIPSRFAVVPLITYPGTQMRIVRTSGTHYELAPYPGMTYNDYLKAQKKIRYGPVIRR